MQDKTIPRRLMWLASIGALGASVVYSASFASAADHLDAPSVQNDGRTDLNDLYVFQSPRNANNTVLILTVNPAAGVISGTTFDPKASYTFNIDSSGDAVADKTITIDFKQVTKKGQRFKVQIDGSTVAQGKVGETTELRKSGGKVTAGVFDDPFFFDLNGFQNGFAFTGEDFFAGFNASAIVVEIPSAQLSPKPNIGVWASTSDKHGQQIDRIGRPAINTVLIPAERKDEFNTSQPSDDSANFGSDVRAAITALSNPDNAAALTPILLPDVLTINTGNASGFLNGRALADDVIDAELSLLSAGAVSTDGVGANDAAFTRSFPYLAPANR